jgi:hypothetical protein
MNLKLPAKPIFPARTELSLENFLQQMINRAFVGQIRY